MKVIPFPDSNVSRKNLTFSGQVIVSVYSDETGIRVIEVDTDFPVSQTTDILIGSASILNTPELLNDTQNDP